MMKRAMTDFYYFPKQENNDDEVYAIMIRKYYEN